MLDTASNRQTDWIERAKGVLPGGGFGNFDPSLVIREGHGAKVVDEDGNEYIDYLIGSGPMLLGHGHPEVLEAVHAQLSKGMTFFANNAAGIELAEVIVDAMPCAEQLRYVSTGGEADMYAMRLARAHTGREVIVKFEGGYHGMSADALMNTFPKGNADYPKAQPDTAGIPAAVQASMRVCPYNDFEYVADLMAKEGDQVAAIIVEPLQRIVPPKAGFLQHLRDLADKYGAVLIFDEVVTGFRFSYQGAQGLYGVTPDLCTLGKTIGGGLPLAAIAGQSEIMRHFDATATDRFVLQIGTLSGNPLAAVAGLKTLEVLSREGQYERLTQVGLRLQTALSESLSKRQIAHQIVGEASLFDVVFSDKPIENYRDVARGDAEAAKMFNKVLRDEGILKSPSKIYPHLGLSDDDVLKTISAFETAAEHLAAR
ncbi:MAG: aminotransferase class III-fold pyridoxal phosphate-dependent enzyme [Gammaproteobacteria bacterium]|nr:aminotransferase class III-fold pyridoxal phosphate-dependent enzyme [Gammaproteobacteria bacterium]